jgi:hypothetical protein
MKTQNTKNQTLTVKLSHRGNPDIDYRGGYWQETQDSGKTIAVKVADFAEASAVCSDYIRRNGLGGGNWTGGNIYQGRTKVGRVSFNGRVWDVDGNEIIVE